MPSHPDPARVREVLDQALERPTSMRRAFILECCEQDADLGREVISLLSALDDAGDWFEPPVSDPLHLDPQPLTGLQFGVYVVGDRLGSGGMGVVYQARDTRLERTVAVKALPPALANDRHRWARFEREAKLLASINHPNIATIYGIEDTSRGPVMLLEYVPGATLADELSRRSLVGEERLRVVTQIARALEAAHVAGVVHRDLKPANIVITPEGVVKVLDFGIATLAARHTSVYSSEDQRVEACDLRGLGVVGTAAYMSPEQCQGKPLDRRSDMWAFGCIVYEMYTGLRPFERATPKATLEAILIESPDWARLEAAAPPGVVRVVRRCLVRDLDRRQRDAGDARLDLDDAQVEPVPRSATHRTWWAAGVLGFFVIALALAWKPWTPETPSPVSGVAVEVETPDGLPLWMGVNGSMALTPDGKTLIVSCGSATDSLRLMTRHLDSFSMTAVAGPTDAAEPFVSPDGRVLGYYDYDSKHYSAIPLTGGATRAIVRVDGTPQGACWLGESLVYSGETTRGLWIASPNAEPRRLTTISSSDLEQMHAQPDASSSTNRVVFTVCTSDARGFRTRIDVLRLDTGARSTLIQDASQPQLVDPNRLAYVQHGDIAIDEFNTDGMSLKNKPFILARGLAGDEAVPFRRYAISRDGSTLASLPDPATYLTTRLIRVSPDGRTRTLVEGLGALDEPRVSPDGTQVALLIGRSSADIWSHDLARGTTTRLTLDRAAEHPVWSRDGQRIYYRSTRPSQPMAIESIPVTSVEAPRLLWSFAKGLGGYPTDVMPDDTKVLLTCKLSADTGEDLYSVSASGENMEPLLQGNAYRLGARLSPDGTKLAYVDSESGRFEVYVRAFPSLDRRVQVSVEGGYRPTWSRDGASLYFRLLDRIYVADVIGDELRFARPRILFEHLPDARFDVLDNGDLLLPAPSGAFGPNRKVRIIRYPHMRNAVGERGDADTSR